ncbi:J domain-containing protein DDB_G0295729-like isoform X2 [Mizuhopecten yessoensis]|uniref:Schwannomin-interacting protein 1 n=1 Tax=Mizuhopecten yessoensis TaxID=6573 RepID=A0A210QK18_MIZYE|nr:J domain-containing protein DDB_G0295729-like isoform X2 [Mizuhopecten yessoensis]OWF49095.1 Schwannomin-interacting protein 1 [Mizuhopecten yessoensis]
METAGEDLESARAGYPKLQTESDVQLHQPDLEQLKHDRFERNRHVMETLDKRAAKAAFPQVSPLDKYEQAALCIQRNYRGYIGRKLYTDFLYDKYAKEEQARLEKMLAQYEEGELLVENHKLEVLLDDNTTTRRNRSRNYLSHVITIQRAWRSYSRRKRIVDSDSDDDSIEELEELKILHDGSEKQKMTQTNPDCSPQSEAVHVVLEDASQSESLNKRDSSEEKDYYIEKRSSSEDKEYSPGPLFTSPAHRLVSKVRYEHDSDSLSSDYSEFSAPLKDLADSEVTIIQRQQLAEGNIQQSMRTTSSNVIRKPFESEEDFSRRIRKLNFLSIAQEFAELKKVNCDILPFDLHKGQQFSESSCSDTSSAPASQISSEMNTPSDPSDSFVQLNNGVNNLMSKDLNSNINNGNVDERDNNSLSTATRRSNTTNDNLPPHTSTTDTSSTVSTVRVAKRSRDLEEENSNKGDKSDVTDSDRGDNPYNDEGEGDFDVYNIETAVPQMNWEILGQQLEQVTLHQQSLQRQRQQQAELQQQPEQKPRSQRNDREEIRRKLAMGGLEEDYYGGERSYKKPNLSKRLQSGMNLQICFMNESPGEEPDPVKSSPQKSDLFQEDKTMMNKLDSTDVKNSLAAGSNPDLSDNKMSMAAERTGKSGPPGAKQLTDEDFFKKQARLQREAKIALAQASTMAHMQLEVEKQMKKKSPVTDIVGLPLLGDRIMSWGNKPLHEMNLAQLQVLVNDLHSQIEKLNEDLVRLLMERDELHMSQDSMLVDIEDLTRRAEDKAKKFNTQPGKKGSNSKRS